mgnify:FL=1
MRNRILGITLCLFSLGGIAQEERPLLNDSIAVLQAGETDSILLPVEAYLRQVRYHHPIGRQALLIRMRAEAERLKAAGNFDPKLFSEIQQKYFDEKTYFQLQNSGLQIPAWFGLSAKAGYELNEGLFLNNQNTVPGSGLWYGEVNWTLGRGLFIDQRRAAIKQARLLQEAAEFELLTALNDLMQDALAAYWNWYESYQILLVYREALDLAQFRFEATRREAQAGDRALVDTLESIIQVQDRALKLQEAQAAFVQSSNELETFLWLDGMVPLALGDSTYPGFDLPSLNPLPLDWLEEHPQLQSTRFQIESNQVALRLAREGFKPQVDLSYKFLNEPGQPDDFFAEYSVNNYEWALSASFPIFVRKARGQVGKARAKVLEKELDLDLKTRQIQNKVEALQAELSINLQRVVDAQAIVNNYRRLLAAENIRFRNGESSLFLVNRRELKYLESREKLIELEAKINVLEAKLQQAAGVLHERVTVNP